MAEARRHPKYRLRSLANRVMRRFAANPLVAWLRRAATATAALALVAVPYFKFADSLDTKAYPYLGWLAARKTGAILAILLTQAICQLLAWILSWFERHDLGRIHEALDQIAARHFPNADLSQYRVRATLFKKRRAWLLGCWLGAVDRSGENYRRLRSIFSVNDNIESENTGVAGLCYWTEMTVCLEVKPVDDEPTPAQTGDYKSKTHLTDEEYDCLLLKSCFFLATCIKVNGKKWGVLVLDTNDPNAAPSSKTMEKRRRGELEHATGLLATLLR